MEILVVIVAIVVTVCVMRGGTLGTQRKEEREEGWRQSFRGTEGGRD